MNNSRVRQLIYLSAAVTNMEEVDLACLLAQARRRNEQLGITGMLVYADGNFLQVLEGEPDILEDLLNVIREDPRHTRFMVLVDRTITEREFGDWSMGFRVSTRSEIRKLTGFNDIFRKASAPATQGRVTAARTVLLSFLRCNDPAFRH